MCKLCFHMGMDAIHRNPRHCFMTKNDQLLTVRVPTAYTVRGDDAKIAFFFNENS